MLSLSSKISIDKLLLAMMKEKRYKSDYQLLRSIPGVGAQTATTILLECGIWPTSARLTHFALLSGSS